MNNEEIYDAEIAPELMRLAKRCEELGMSFVACVDFDPECGGIGKTEFQAADERGKLSAAQRLVHWAARCNGNIDRLFLTCDRHAQKHGHSSFYLSLCGNKNVRYSENEMAAITITQR